MNTERTLTRLVLSVYLLHALAVPVIALWVICSGDVPHHLARAQLAGFFPAVLFLALTAIWTELPGRLDKAVLLAAVVPTEVGIGAWLIGRDLSFYFVEVFFVDIVAMELAFLVMVALQLKDKARPFAIGCIMLGLTLLAFGGPIWEVYRAESWVWGVGLAAMVATDVWAYMYVFGRKALPFERLADDTERRPGFLDRLLPDRFDSVSWGASDAVAVPVVLAGLAIWAILPFIAGG